MFVNQIKTILFATMTLTLFTFSSCNKEEPTPEPTPAPAPVVVTDSFTAKVDGTVFSETAYTGYIFGSSIIVQATVLNENINFLIPIDITAGTYSYLGAFGSLRGNYSVGTASNDFYSADSGTGTLVISSHNTTTKVIQGTFSFVANPSPGNSNTNSYNITEGSFALNY